MASPHKHPLVRRLRSFGQLPDSEAQALAALPMTVRKLRADKDFVTQGDRPTQTCVVLEGLAAMYKITGPGRRQILNFYVPGDIPDLHSLHLDIMDSSIGTMTPCTIGFIQHDLLRELCRARPQLADALWKMTLIDASVFREWIVNIGQREAGARLAHLLCEMYVRLGAIGQAENGACDFPITQQELADATGVSVVHINRMLQDLRGQGLISLTQRRLEVLDWDRLKEAGDFDATYLNLEQTRY